MLLRVTYIALDKMKLNAGIIVNDADTPKIPSPTRFNHKML